MRHHQCRMTSHSTNEAGAPNVGKRHSRLLITRSSRRSHCTVHSRRVLTSFHSRKKSKGRGRGGGNSLKGDDGKWYRAALATRRPFFSRSASIHLPLTSAARNNKLDYSGFDANKNERNLATTCVCVQYSLYSLYRELHARNSPATVCCIPNAAAARSA